MNKAATFLISAMSLLNLMACSSQIQQANEIQAKNSTGIIGGEEVGAIDSIGKRTVMLLRFKNQEVSGSCSATPISKTVLLTAAHCVRDADGIAAYFGRNFADIDKCVDNGCAIPAIKVIAHPQFVESDVLNGYDIGLVKLAKPIPDSYKITELASEEDSIGQYVTAGYGRTGYDNAGSTGLLRKVLINEKDVSHTKSILQFLSATCSGDSGGPVFNTKSFKTTVIGINSGVQELTVGADPCRGHNFATYVPFYREWIMQNMKTLDPQ